MNEALAKIDAEIERRRQEMAGLELARAILAGPGKPAKAPLLLTHAKKKRGPKIKKPKPSADPNETEFGTEVNGIFINMTEQQAALFNVLDDAAEGECVSLERLQALHGGSVSHVYNDLRVLRDALAPAKATIGNVRGEGYRLENLEGEK